MKSRTKLSHKLFQFIVFLIGVFILSIGYNTILLPNAISTGGTSGIAIVLKELFGWDTSLFILISGLFLLGISFIFLGNKTTRRNILGTLLYPAMLSLTVPMAKWIIPHLKFDDFLVLISIGGAILGLGYGLVYRAGYSTGGFDVIIQLLNRYLKLPEGKAAKVSNFIVIFASLPVIGLRNVVYGAIILVIEEAMTNKITIGVSDSKLFFVYTRKLDEVRDALVRKKTVGFTIIPTIGGYSHYKGQMLMCVVSTRDYYAFREIVLDIDPNAFFVIDDCYEVNGGFKKQHLPFL